MSTAEERDYFWGLPLATAQTETVLSDVADERVAQVEKWGVQTRPDGTGGEWTPAADRAKSITDARSADGSVTWTDILLEEVFEALAESDHDALREELIQVAAVALSWAEDIDRKALEAFRAARVSQTS